LPSVKSASPDIESKPTVNPMDSMVKLSLHQGLKGLNDEQAKYFDTALKSNKELNEAKEVLPDDILSKFLDKFGTDGIDKLIMSAWEKMPESKQKLAIGIPGIKGSVNAEIIKRYKTDARIKLDDKKYIGVVSEFEYRGLGNHPSNNNTVEFGITTNSDESELIIFTGLIKYPKISIKISKSLYKDL
jgi:hypothetical protein